MHQNLHDLLTDLTALDSGSDVDWVVGLAAAIPRVPESIHVLGTAPVLGRHFVMRSLHDLAEYELVRQAFDQIDPGEREQLLLERKRHKEQAVFLHEWGHTLGAIHELHADLIMNPIYHSDERRLADGNAQVIEWAMRRRIALGLEWRAGAHAELQTLLSSIHEESWEPVELEETLRSLRSSVRVEQTRQTAGGEINLLLETADGYLRSGQAVEAGLTLQKAHEQLAQSHASAANTAEWERLARLYRKRQWPSLAMTAAQRADRQTSASFSAWYLSMRRRLALPVDGASSGLIPTREHEYIALLERADLAISKQKHAEVEQILGLLTETFPKLPASQLIRCEWEFSRGRLAEAVSSCSSVLQKNPEASTAHLLLGLVAEQRQKPREAIIHLNRAIAFDPDQRAAWFSLSTALRQVGDLASIKQLNRQFTARFGTTMP